MDVEKALIKKGFEKANGDHNYFVYMAMNGKKTAVRTHTSQSHRDIDDSIIKHMARQCHLSIGEFKKLVDCPLQRREYEKLLLENKVIRF